MTLLKTSVALVTSDQLPLDSSNWISQISGSWEDLAPDEHVTDEHRRFRSYGQFTWPTKKLSFKSPKYFQSLDMNKQYGGISRQFQHLNETIYNTQGFKSLIEYISKCIDWNFSDNRQLLVDVHQIRIVATKDRPGVPCPEGIHRDGLLYFAIIFIAGDSYIGGTTSIYDNYDNLVFEDNLDLKNRLLIGDDRAIKHYTSDFSPCPPNQTAFRDVLLLGFKSN